MRSHAQVLQDLKIYVDRHAIMVAYLILDGDRMTFSLSWLLVRCLVKLHQFNHYNPSP